MQICTSPQTTNHCSIPPLSFFTGQMPFLPHNQQRWSTEGKFRIQSVARIRNPQDLMESPWPHIVTDAPVYLIVSRFTTVFFLDYPHSLVADENLCGLVELIFYRLDTSYCFLTYLPATVCMKFSDRLWISKHQQIVFRLHEDSCCNLVHG